MVVASENEILTTEQVLKVLRISKSTLYRLMDEGLLEPIEVNKLLKRQKKLYFSREDVERLLRQSA